MSDDPIISEIMATGYPSRHQNLQVFCCECGDELTGDIYEDEKHDALCKDCLLMLHLREDY